MKNTTSYTVLMEINFFSILLETLKITNRLKNEYFMTAKISNITPGTSEIKIHVDSNGHSNNEFLKVSWSVTCFCKCTKDDARPVTCTPWTSRFSPFFNFTIFVVDDIRIVYRTYHSHSNMWKSECLQRNWWRWGIMLNEKQFLRMIIYYCIY